MMVEDPYLTVITQPCGPWGNWSRFNLAKGGQSALTVLDLRERGRSVLKLVNKTVVGRIKAKRHVFIEQPLGSSWLEEEELKDVVNYINDGVLIPIRVDGCQVGYKDQESGLPHHKPSIYYTTLLTAESCFQGLLCGRDHQHEKLEGRNQHGSRTAQASVWPDKLNDMVLQCMLQQGAAEQLATNGVLETFPSEVRPAEQQLQPVRIKRKRATGRVSQLTDQYNAPPVYVRPDQPIQPEPVQEDDPGQEQPPQHLDDASLRAVQVADFDPVLNSTEAERRRRWLTIDPEIRKILRDLHVQFGHPTNTTLQRILRRQGAVQEAIRGAELLSCDACGDSIRRRRPKPVRLPGRYVFNHHLMIDVFYGKDVTGANFSFLNIVDDATGYQVVSCLGQAQGPPASRAILRHFLTCWSSWAGLPQSIQVDRGKEYLAYFSDYLKEVGVEQETIPLEAPWQNGKVERAGGIWKEILYKTVQEMQLSGVEDMVLASTIISQCRNSFPRPNGYSPSQWVLGISEVRVPGSLLDTDESQKLEVMEAANNPSSALAKSLNIRESARVAQIRLDTDSRVRRALLHQSTPTRGPYPVGSYVYFYRLQTPIQARAQGRNYRWFGPARVIGVELRNQRRSEDPELPTEGGQPHAYWLRYGPSVILVTGEQLRFASEDELLAAHHTPEEILQPSYARTGARNFVDLRGHAAQPQQQDPDFLPPSIRQGRMDLGPDASSPAGTAAPGLEPVPEGGEMDLDLTHQPPGLSPLQDQRTGEEMMEPEPVPVPSSTPMPSQNSTPLPSRRPSLAPTGQQPATPLTQALRQEPDRLDGHPAPPTDAIPTPAASTSLAPRQMGYQPMRSTPTRHGIEQAHGPYFVNEDEMWDCPDLPHSVRLRQLQNMSNYNDEDEDTLDDESFDEESYVAASPAHAFLTGRAASTEVSLKTLNDEDRRKFDVSMEKEWNSWKQFGAVEILTPEQVQQLPDDTPIIGTRWVHTDKNKKPRLMAKACQKRTKKTDAQIQKEFPFQAKSRLVVQGHQEDPQSIRTDSPTASLLAFNLVCAIAAMNNWWVTACDASTAYLQSQGISRLLILRPPRPPPPGVSPQDLFRACGSIYGTKDAGRSWWRKLYKTLKKYQWKMSGIETALFMLVIDGNLKGILITHVDDLFCAGEGEVYHQTLKSMETEIYLKIQHREFRFCGKNVKQLDDFTIELDQMDAIEAIDYMVLTKDRRAMANAPLTPAEVTSFRGLIGQMGWVTRQTRPDLMVNVSMAAQSMGSPKIKDVVALNKAVKMMKETAEAKWRFVHSPDLQLHDLVVCVFADSSFANIDGTKSQCGFVVVLTTKDIKNGGNSPIHILETYSGSIKRVCRSTLAAEANGFLTGVEAGEYVRSLILELQNPREKINVLEKEFGKSKLICITDAKSLESTLNKDTGQPTDRRVRILVAQIKEMIGENDYTDDDFAYAWWVDTSQMLADVLTKLGCEREPLLTAMHDGTWQLEPSADALAKKASIRAARHLRKSRAASKDGCKSEKNQHGSD